MQALNSTRQQQLAGSLELADTFVASLIGLMGRRTFPSGHGLWITHCQSVHTIWMCFAIDVVFLDSHRKILYLIENLKPFRLSRHVAKASSVIELPANVIHSTKTCVGDQIIILP